MLMLIDTRDQRPEPPRDDWRRLATLVGRLFPWPAIIAWLFIGTLVIRGGVGAVFALVLLGVAFWRLSKLYPESGLSDYSQ